MDRRHVSSHLFEIAKDVGIPLELGQEEPFEDAAFEAFRTAYNDWSTERDEALRRHLHVQRAFRGYVPYGEDAFRLVYQVLWYFDEIIVRDPVWVLMEPPMPPETPEERSQVIARTTTGVLEVIHRGGRDRLEARKAELRVLVQQLALLKPTIDAGLLLLAGGGALPDLPDSPAGLGDKLTERPEIDEALMDSARFALEAKKGKDGGDWYVFEIRLGHTGILGFHKPEGVSGRSPDIQVGERLRSATPQEMAAIMGRDPREDARQLFGQEVEFTLGLLEVANQLLAIPVFHRQSDATILNTCADIVRPAVPASASMQTFNVMLPYFEGVPRESLVELRLEDTLAFRELRSLFLSAVQRGMADARAEPIDAFVDRKISPLVRDAEIEMKALGKKRLAAYAAASLPVLGGLGGYLLGVPVAPLLLAAVAGLSGAAREVGKILSAETRLMKNPAFFVWKARQER